MPGQTTNQTFVINLYKLLLNRPPDDSGLKYWAGKLDAGESTTQMVEEFQASDEYRNLLINNIYQAYLRRPATTQELADRRNYLAAGNTVDELKADVLGSGPYYETQGQGTNLGFLQSLYQD